MILLAVIYWIVRPFVRGARKKRHDLTVAQRQARKGIRPGYTTEAEHARARQAGQDYMAKLAADRSRRN